MRRALTVLVCDSNAPMCNFLCCARKNERRTEVLRVKATRVCEANCEAKERAQQPSIIDAELYYFESASLFILHHHEFIRINRTARDNGLSSGRRFKWCCRCGPWSMGGTFKRSQGGQPAVCRRVQDCQQLSFHSHRSVASLGNTVPREKEKCCLRPFADGHNSIQWLVLRCGSEARSGLGQARTLWGRVSHCRMARHCFSLATSTSQRLDRVSEAFKATKGMVCCLLPKSTARYLAVSFALSMGCAPCSIKRKFSDVINPSPISL